MAASLFGDKRSGSAHRIRLVSVLMSRWGRLLITAGGEQDLAWGEVMHYNVEVQVHVNLIHSLVASARPLAATASPSLNASSWGQLGQGVSSSPLLEPLEDDVVCRHLGPPGPFPWLSRSVPSGLSPRLLHFLVDVDFSLRATTEDCC